MVLFFKGLIFVQFFYSSTPNKKAHPHCWRQASASDALKVCIFTFLYSIRHQAFSFLLVFFGLQI